MKEKSNTEAIHRELEREPTCFERLVLFGKQIRHKNQKLIGEDVDSDEEIEIKIVTKSKKPFTYSTEKWSKTVTIEEVIQMSQSDEAPKMELEKKTSSRGEFCKATARTIRTVINRFTTRHHEGEGETSVETHPRTEQRVHAQTEISIKFKVYIT